jgi:hypothetical protein
MKITFQILRPLMLTVLMLGSFTASTFAQEVSVPDPGLNAAVRAASPEAPGFSKRQPLPLTRCGCFSASPASS